MGIVIDENIQRKCQLKFDNSITMEIKGAAIILMVCNHLFPIPEWIYPENNYFSLSFGSKTIASYIGGFGKICVAIFAFLTGIAMFYTYSKAELKKSWVHTLRKLPRFLGTYWMILFVVYIPIIYLGGEKTFNVKELFLNLFGYQTTYCRIAWYVRFYLELVISFPIWVILYRELKKWLQSCNLNMPFVVLIAIQWGVGVCSKKIQFGFSGYLAEYFGYITIVMFGFYVAEKDLLSKIFMCFHKYSNVIRCVVSAIFLTGCFCGRGIIKQFMEFNLDFIYAPIVILAIWLLLDAIEWERLNAFFSFLGRYSVEIWFLHAIFFIGNSNVQKIGYWPKWSFFILVWVLLLLLPVSMLVHRIVSGILDEFNKIIESNRL